MNKSFMSSKYFYVVKQINYPKLLTVKNPGPISDLNGLLDYC